MTKIEVESLPLESLMIDEADGELGVLVNTVFQKQGQLKTFRKIKWDDSCVTIVTCDQDVKTVKRLERREELPFQDSGWSGR